ncbi:dephospho-CoA kinase [Alistipes timonensis]|nr:dephospho-CoA kinase [Alistipes timonensis]MCR2030944.1 dephospho-CoA kinase [Alistipes timonensis]
MKVGITGGIGSGKSTVCRLFAQRGVAVYDSDAEAKRLMAESPELRAAVSARFGAEAYAGGALNRPYLAGKVFSDPAALADLNALVHPAVLADFAAWAERQEGSYVILESAILFDAGLEDSVDRTVAVLAPLELRLERTCRRDKCDPEAVRRRIAAQSDDDVLSEKADYTLVNIFEPDLEPTVAELDRIFTHEAAEY